MEMMSSARHAEFYTARNNGILAVMTAEHYTLVQSLETRPDPTRRKDWEELLEAHDIRIFAFCNKNRLRNHPEQLLFFSGDEDDFWRLVQDRGVREGNFYVPFSCGERRMKCDKHFIVCHCDVTEAFGEKAETCLT